MEVIRQCRDCIFYSAEDFTCEHVKGYAFYPNDYCLKRGHLKQTPCCKNCKYSDYVNGDKFVWCKVLFRYMDEYGFCSFGVYKDE